MTQAYSEKKSESSYQEPNLRPSNTSSDALPLSHRRLVEAKSIKLGSWDKHNGLNTEFLANISMELKKIIIIKYW